MKMSNRETVLLLATVVVIVFGVSLVLARPLFDQIKEVRAERDGLAAAIEYDRDLVEQEEMWQTKLEELSKLYDPPKRWLEEAEKVLNK